MTTLKAFDEMMNQFISDIAQAFPDETPKKPVSSKDFMRMIAPWISQVTTRDPSFFCDENEFATSFDLQKIWKREDCSETTRSAIWQYISSLYMIATTVSMFPAETLNMIEATAEKCAQKMQGKAMNEQTLMEGVNSMLSQILSQGAIPGLPAVPSSPRQRPRPKKKTK